MREEEGRGPASLLSLSLLSFSSLLSSSSLLPLESHPSKRATAAAAATTTATTTLVTRTRFWFSSSSYLRRVLCFRGRGKKRNTTKEDLSKRTLPPTTLFFPLFPFPRSFPSRVAPPRQRTKRERENLRKRASHLQWRATRATRAPATRKSFIIISSSSAPRPRKMSPSRVPPRRRRRRLRRRRLR